MQKMPVDELPQAQTLHGGGTVDDSGGHVVSQSCQAHPPQALADVANAR
jgi:hypothetical protein